MRCFDDEGDVQSILTITTPADSLLLLTDAELRRATGVASGNDTEHTALNKAVAAAVTSRCRVRASGATPATLRMETITEVFRLQCPIEELILARRPIVGITSIVEDLVTLTADTDYEISNAAAGFVQRLCDDYPAWWSASKITVVYQAGWSTVPENLKSAASKLATGMWSEAGRDSGLKSITIPDVITKEYWVGPSDDPLFTREIEELLADYINPAMG
jgi:hypothetical protein